MLGQNVLMELNTGDRVQIYAYTSSGINDNKNIRTTQFLGEIFFPHLPFWRMNILAFPFQVFCSGLPWRAFTTR